GGLGDVTVDWRGSYDVKVSLMNVSGISGDYNASCAIYDFGTDGQTPGPNVVTFATLQNHIGNDIAMLPAVWVGLRAYQNAGIDAWDNFAVYTANSAPVFTVLLTNTTIAAGNAP